MFYICSYWTLRGRGPLRDRWRRCALLSAFLISFGGGQSRIRYKRTRCNGTITVFPAEFRQCNGVTDRIRLQHAGHATPVRIVRNNPSRRSKRVERGGNHRTDGVRHFGGARLRKSQAARANRRRRGATDPCRRDDRRFVARHAGPRRCARTVAGLDADGYRAPQQKLERAERTSWARKTRVFSWSRRRSRWCC